MPDSDGLLGAGWLPRAPSSSAAPSRKLTASGKKASASLARHTAVPHQHSACQGRGCHCWPTPWWVCEAAGQNAARKRGLPERPLAPIRDERTWPRDAAGPPRSAIGSDNAPSRSCDTTHNYRGAHLRQGSNGPQDSGLRLRRDRKPDGRGHSQYAGYRRCRLRGGPMARSKSLNRGGIWQRRWGALGLRSGGTLRARSVPLSRTGRLAD